MPTSSRLTLAELNRTEALKSVLISLLLQMPSVVEDFINLLKGIPAITMRDHSGQPGPFALENPGQGVQVSPLFHIYRDFTKAGIDVRPLAERNEIDIVLVWPGRLALGLEIKWHSSTIGLNEQLRQEREAIAAVARYYDAKRTSLIAVLPRDQNKSKYPEADGLLTAADIAAFASSVLSSGHPLESLIINELNLMIPEKLTWKTTDLAGVLGYTPTSPQKNSFVGFTGGLSALKGRSCPDLMARPHWKIIETNRRNPPNECWIRLEDARHLIRQRTQEGAL